MGNRFHELVGQISQIGYDYHAQTILKNSSRNAAHVQRTIREVPQDLRRCVVVSAGPSLYRNRSLEKLAGFSGCVVATDGAYIRCLKSGIRPDWVVTIDPHPTRIVRWFGDPDWEEHSKEDDYFSRQDLDVAFRQASKEINESNKSLVDKSASGTKLVAATVCSQALVQRVLAAKFEIYWAVPLVDDPDSDGLTRKMCEATKAPALNTGGTVGTAAWAFAHQILGSKDIAVVGMDFGYPIERPLQETQEWNLLKDKPDVQDFYPKMLGVWGECYTSPTYWWYRQNFLDLLEAADARITNCTEGGLLFGDRVDCTSLESWLHGKA